MYPYPEIILFPSERIKLKSWVSNSQSVILSKFRCLKMHKRMECTSLKTWKRKVEL